MSEGDKVRLYVAGACRAVKNREEYVELMLTDLHGVRYGPLRISAGRLYCSKPMNFENASELKKRLASAFPNCNPELKRYGTYRQIVWMRTHTSPEKDKVWRDFRPLLERITTDDRIYNAFSWPLPAVDVSADVLCALKKQNELHGHLRDSYLRQCIPIMERNGTYSDFVKVLKKDAKNTVRFARKYKEDPLPDSFFEPNTAVIESASALDALLQAIKPASSPDTLTEHCWKSSSNSSLNCTIYASSGVNARSATDAEQSMLESTILQNSVAFDIEVADWWTDKPEIYSFVVSGLSGNVVHGIFPINGALSAMGEQAEYCLEKNSTRLLLALGDCLRGANMHMGHNIIGYDYPVCSKRSGVFLPGNDNSPPSSLAYRRGIMDEHGRKASSDAVVIDTAYFARVHLNSLLGDFKLETVAELLHRLSGLDTYYQKIQTYAENDSLVELARKGDENAARSLMMYTAGDGVVSKRIGLWAAERVMKIANALGINYFYAGHETPRNIALIAGDRVDYANLNKPRDHSRYPRFYSKFRKKELEEIFDKRLGNVFSPGEHQNALVAYYPLWKHVEKHIKHRCGKMIQLANDSKSLDALIYNQILDGFASELFADLEPGILPFLGEKKFSMIAPNTPDAVVRGKYHSGKKEIFDSFSESLDTCMKADFAGVTVLNRNNNLFFLSGLSEEEALSRGFIPLGVADKIISVGKGRVIHRLKGGIMSTGIAIPSRKKRAEQPGINRDCALKIMAVYDFVNAYFNSGISSACKVAHSYASHLRDKTVDPSLLAFKVTQKVALQNRGVQQQRTRTARIEKKFKLSPGESVVSAIASPEEYIRYDVGKKAFDSPFSPAYETYLDEIFGVVDEDGKKKQSTLYSIAKALLVHNRSRKAREQVKDCLTANAPIETFCEMLGDKTAVD